MLKPMFALMAVSSLMIPQGAKADPLPVETATVAPAPAVVPNVPQQAGERRTLSFADGWRFMSPADGDVADPSLLDEAAMQPVTVPHTWNRIGYYGAGTGTGTNSAETVNRVQGVGWYVRHFATPSLERGQRVWIEFDAASRIADVWLNGHKLGTHAGGFSRFRFDATDALAGSNDNRLVVRVDNSERGPDSSTADVLPLGGDFFVRGGLYRPVRLIVTNAVHIDMLDHGGPGVYARSEVITPDAARLSVTARLSNESGRTRRVSLRVRLLDSDGRVAGETHQTARVGAGEPLSITLPMTVRSPHLWQGTADPYLYTLSVEVRDGGTMIDRVNQPFGIRDIRIDPDRGMMLNGVPYRLHGVGLHQDREGPDWAMSDADIAAAFDTIRDMGANSIRLTHYQHGQTIHELADRYGFILWDEIPLVTLWTRGNEMEPRDALIAQARQQLSELIRQNYNHASVAVWGIANEVDFGPARPDFLGSPPAVLPDPVPLLRLLNAHAKAEDPSRATVLATCCQGRDIPLLPNVDGVTDAIGDNRYFGWYFGVPADLGPHLDALHARRTTQPMAVTEYGAGAAVSLHSDDPLGGPVDFAGPRQPEEYQTWLHEQTWPIIRSRSYLWGSWLWNSFDFGSTVRREGGSTDINTKGLVSYDGRVRKDAFFYYRANWSDQPTVHLVGRRYVQRAYETVDVRVYSNAASTELTVNAQSLGARTDCPDHVCVWQGVRLSAGTNAIAATGQFAGQAVTDRIEWQLAPAQVSHYRIDSGALVAATDVPSQFGSDAFFSGGRSGTTDRAGWGRPPVRPEIAGAISRDLLASYRQGQFSYALPIDNGDYVVTLSFVEPDRAAGQRAFNVLANGDVAMRAFDVAAAAGGLLRTVRRSFPVQVRNGRLALDFVPVRGDAIVSAVEVVPARP